MYYVVTVATFVTMGLALARAILGPSVYDRVLAVNMFGTKTVLLLSVVAFLYGRPDFLDLALAYALINFIGILAVLQFFENREAGIKWDLRPELSLTAAVFELERESYTTVDPEDQDQLIIVDIFNVVGLHLLISGKKLGKLRARAPINLSHSGCGRRDQSHRCHQSSATQQISHLHQSYSPKLFVHSIAQCA